jgi:hypothetical protein
MRLEKTLLRGTTEEWMLVTPEMAEKWLATTVVNRHLRNYIVDQYARDMKAGSWADNGSALLFASDGEIPDYAAPEGVRKVPEGTLLDGQHRLWASIVSKTSFYTRVVSGVDPKAWKTIDSGLSRKPSDMLCGEKYVNDLAAVVTWLWRWQNCSSLASQKRPTRNEREELLLKNSGIRDAVFTAREWTDKTSQLLPRSMVSFLLYAFAVKDQERAEAFIHGLVSGEGLHATGKTAPIYVLRVRLEKSLTKKDRFPLIERLAAVIKAWNLFRKGADRCPERALTWARYSQPPEKFPTIQ